MHSRIFRKIRKGLAIASVSLLMIFSSGVVSFPLPNTTINPVHAARHFNQNAFLRRIRNFQNRLRRNIRRGRGRVSHEKRQLRQVNRVKREVLRYIHRHHNRRKSLNLSRVESRDIGRYNRNATGNFLDNIHDNDQDVINNIRNNMVLNGNTVNASNGNGNPIGKLNSRRKVERYRNDTWNAYGDFRNLLTSHQRGYVYNYLRFTRGRMRNYNYAHYINKISAADNALANAIESD